MNILDGLYKITQDPKEHVIQTPQTRSCRLVSEA